MTEARERLVARLAALPDAPVLDLVCHGAVEFVGVSGAAVILMSADETGSLAASYGPHVAAVEDLQFALGEGPCLAAYHDGVPVLEPDIGRAAREWPVFAPAATAAGVGAVFALPMQIGAIRVGVLYLVRETTGALSDEQLADALRLAKLATTAVLDRHIDGSADGISPDGWAHRAVVHQATGMVAAQLDVPLADALAQLRARAYTLNRSIYHVATEVVGRTLRFTHDGETGGYR